MQYTLEIEIENSSFEDNGTAEIARILREAATYIEASPSRDWDRPRMLHDENGNLVGQHFFSEEQ